MSLDFTLFEVFNYAPNCFRGKFFSEELQHTVVKRNAELLLHLPVHLMTWIGVVSLLFQ